MIRRSGGWCGVVVSRERVKSQNAVRQVHIELWVRGVWATKKLVREHEGGTVDGL